jgi:hypothetical protein
MRNIFGVVVLVTGALFCFYTSWSSATAPGEFAERLGLKVLNAGGVNEVRAQYAGFFFAVALICIAPFIGLLPRTTPYLLLVTLFGGLFIGRLASLVANGGVQGYGQTILALYAIDGVVLALAAAAYILDKPIAR